MAFRAALSFSSSAVSSSISFDRREDNEGIEGEFKWWAFILCRLSEDGGGVAEFGGDISVVGREQYSVELEGSSDVRWVPGSPSRTLHIVVGYDELQVGFSYVELDLELCLCFIRIV